MKNRSFTRLECWIVSSYGHCGCVFTLEAVWSETTEFIIVDLQFHQWGRESRHFSEVVSIKVQPPELRQVLQQTEKILMTLSKPDWKYFKAFCKSQKEKLHNTDIQSSSGMGNGHFPITLPSTGKHWGTVNMWEEKKHCSALCHIHVTCRCCAWRPVDMAHMWEKGKKWLPFFLGGNIYWLKFPMFTAATWWELSRWCQTRHLAKTRQLLAKYQVCTVRHHKAW